MKERNYCSNNNNTNILINYTSSSRFFLFLGIKLILLSCRIFFLDLLRLCPIHIPNFVDSFIKDFYRIVRMVKIFSTLLTNNGFYKLEVSKIKQAAQFQRFAFYSTLSLRRKRSCLIFIFIWKRTGVLPTFYLNFNFILFSVKMFCIFFSWFRLRPEDSFSPGIYMKQVFKKQV